ncbi:MAG: PilZ domain-containing protein [Chloroflexi bacterium]|nr:PilZ domain-containing protein [Chloroflexota bacterium]
METDRRRQQRRRFTYYMQVIDANTLQFVGHLTDISLTGFRLDSDRPLPVNANYKLRVDLTQDVANKSYLIFTGRSRWCAEDKLEPNLYNVGFEVGGLSYDDSMIFQRMYDRYGADSRW